MNERLFRKLEQADYYEFLKYYTQIVYSYFKDGDATPNQEAKTKFLTMMSEMASPRRVSLNGYRSLLSQGDIYLYETSSGEVLGITLVTPIPSKKQIMIHEFFVLEKYQRQHIGTEMYHDFLYFLKSEDYHRVKIDLQCSFEGAEEFWKSVGFKISKRESFAGGIEYRYYSKVERPNVLLDE